MENLKKKKKSQQYQIDEIAASLQPVAISPSALIVSLHTPKPRVGSAVIIRGVIEV